MIEETLPDAKVRILLQEDHLASGMIFVTASGGAPTALLPIGPVSNLLGEKEADGEKLQMLYLADGTDPSHPLVAIIGTTKEPFRDDPGGKEELSVKFIRLNVPVHQFERINGRQIEWESTVNVLQLNYRDDPWRRVDVDKPPNSPERERFSAYRATYKEW